MRQKEIDSLLESHQNETATLRLSLNEKEEELSKLKNENSVQKTLLEQKNQELDNHKKDLKEKEESLLRLKLQFDSKELKEFSSSFGDEKVKAETKEKLWTKILAISALILTLSVIITSFTALNEPWYDRLELYLINLIFISVIWFSSSQYSYYKNLKNDYANREVIAKSFHSIIRSIELNVAGDIEYQTKDKFIDKAIETLTSKVIQEKLSEPLFYKELIKTLPDIIAAARK